MFKNIIIVVLVLSNLVFLVFAMYQKDLARKMAVDVEAKYMEVVRMEKIAIATEAELTRVRQTSDSLRNELAKFQKITQSE